MVIDTSGKGWVGSEPSDIDEYLRALSPEGDRVTIYQPARCRCGSDRFRCTTAFEIVERECFICGNKHLICADSEDWEEAIDEETPEICVCDCGGDEMNVGAGFAEFSEFDFMKWIYIGYRCCHCGVLGCIADREYKVPRADAQEKV